MRIETQRYTERFGAVRLNDVQRVVELDSGRAEEPSVESVGVQKVDEEVIKKYERDMAIVIPVKDEKLKLFEGVVSGVPHDCLLIVVSNSQRQRVDRFRMEKDALAQYCHFTRRAALIIHQKDEALAEALGEAGYTELLGDDGLLKSGKSEAMIVAMLLAMVARKNYIGFIDADNYFPGSVLDVLVIVREGLSVFLLGDEMLVVPRHELGLLGRLVEKGDLAVELRLLALLDCENLVQFCHFPVSLGCGGSRLAIVMLPEVQR